MSFIHKLHSAAYAGAPAFRARVSGAFTGGPHVRRPNRACGQTLNDLAALGPITEPYKPSGVARSSGPTVVTYRGQAKSARMNTWRRLFICALLLSRTIRKDRAVLLEWEELRLLTRRPTLTQSLLLSVHEET